MTNSKMKSIGVATLKTLGTQYSSFFGIVNQVSELHAEFESEITQVLSLLVEKQNKNSGPSESKSNPTTESISTEVASEQEQKTSQDQGGVQDDDDVTSDTTLPWVKKLFKKIATHCHPDKVLPSNMSATEKHKRMASYEQARSALDEEDKPMMISIGLLYDELAEIGVTESKKILTAGVNALQSTLSEKQKSVVWMWGMSEDDLETKSRILVHAAARLYNMQVSKDEALRVVKEYFEIKESKVARKVGSHPGSRLRDRRKKQNDD